MTTDKNWSYAVGAWKKLLCYTGHHKLIKLKRLSLDTDLIYCLNCRRHFAIHHLVRAVLPYEEVAFLYESEPCPKKQTEVSVEEIAAWFSSCEESTRSWHDEAKRFNSDYKVFRR